MATTTERPLRTLSTDSLVREYVALRIADAAEGLDGREDDRLLAVSVELIRRGVLEGVGSTGPTPTWDEANTPLQAAPSRRTLSRTGWSAAAASVPTTALLLAFGGGTLTTFMTWWLTFGFTISLAGRLYALWLGRNSTTTVTEVPIDYGVGMQPAEEEPKAEEPFGPDFGGHPENCTRCKLQAPTIPAI